MIDNIIEIKQLPVIAERLKELKADIESRTSAAVAMECTEENYKDIKKIRADLNKECKEYEDRRIAVKKAINEPYERFNAVYKECVSNVFATAKAELDKKVAAVEDGLKAQKRDEVLKFAEELKASYALDWLNINRVMPNITLSVSESSLIEKVSDALDKINEDCQCIDDPEIFAEYKKSLNLAQSNLIVANRRKEIEEARLEAERKAHQEEIKQETEKKVEMLAPPVVTESKVIEPKAAERKFVTSFSVKGTMTQIKAIKAFIIENNIEIIGGK